MLSIFVVFVDVLFSFVVVEMCMVYDVVMLKLFDYCLVDGVLWVILIIMLVVDSGVCVMGDMYFDIVKG